MCYNKRDMRRISRFAVHTEKDGDSESIDEMCKTICCEGS